MPAYFTEGFFVRVPAWHGLGVVLDDYPGREEAMRLAGHDFDLVEVPVWTGVAPESILDLDTRSIEVGWKAIKRSDNDQTLHVSQDSYTIIQNSVAYDVAEILLDNGFQYETGITLKDGAQCALTLLLDEPFVIKDDNSLTLPYCNLSWTHDGTGALKVRSGQVRQVCANTVAASEAEGKALGTDFTFRHTRNWKDRVEDAKEAIKGIRGSITVYQERMNDLANLPVSDWLREEWIKTLLPIDPVRFTDRQIRNAEGEREVLRSLFTGPTIPEAHRNTGYGLHCAGVEFFDHIRKYRDQETYVRRTLLRDEPLKANLTKMIYEVVAA